MTKERHKPNLNTDLITEAIQEQIKRVQSKITALQGKEEALRKELDKLTYDKDYRN
jgi:hypothetical protein